MPVHAQKYQKQGMSIIDPDQIIPDANKPIVSLKIHPKVIIILHKLTN